tara:strand:- start:4214 stop:4453 length:240 start_codon:yes stop_codon:yes gene_type:complete
MAKVSEVFSGSFNIGPVVWTGCSMIEKVLRPGKPGGQGTPSFDILTHNQGNRKKRELEGLPLLPFGTGPRRSAFFCPLI